MIVSFNEAYSVSMKLEQIICLDCFWMRNYFSFIERLSLNESEFQMDYVSTLLAADEYLQKQQPAVVLLVGNAGRVCS